MGPLSWTASRTFLTPPSAPPGSHLYVPPGLLPPRYSIFKKTLLEEEYNEILLEEYKDSL